MAMTNEQLTKWIDEIFGTIDEIKQNSGDITGLTRSVKQLRDDLTATQEDVSDLEDQTAGTVSLPKAALQHFTDGSDTQALDLVADIIPVQAGTGDPSPTNVRAISGYSSIAARSNGKNFLPLTLTGMKACNTSGTWSGNSYTRYGCKLTFNTDENDNITSITRDGIPESVFTITFCDYENYTYFLPAGDYTLTGGKNNHEQIAVSRMVNGASTRYGTDTGRGMNFTAISSLVNIFMAIYTTTTTSSETYYPMIRLAADDDPTFEPYTSKTVTISLGSTVYGGTVDFATGALTIDKALVTYTGAESENWSVNTFHDTTVSIGKPSGMTVSSVVSNMYTMTTPESEDDGIFLGANMNVRDSVNATSVETWKTFLGTHNLQILYDLETPVSTTLTPAQLSLLQGENNVSATSGPITLTYAPDNVLAEVYAYIQKRFDTLTASLAAIRTTRKNHQNTDQKGGLTNGRH